MMLEGSSGRVPVTVVDTRGSLRRGLVWPLIRVGVGFFFVPFLVAVVDAAQAPPSTRGGSRSSGSCSSHARWQR